MPDESVNLSESVLVDGVYRVNALDRDSGGKGDAQHPQERGRQKRRAPDGSVPEAVPVLVAPAENDRPPAGPVEDHVQLSETARQLLDPGSGRDRPDVKPEAASLPPPSDTDHHLSIVA